MPFDDTNFDYGDYGMPERLTLKGVYKHQVLGSADYCAYGSIGGEEVLFSERSLKLALNSVANDDCVAVSQVVRAGKASHAVTLDKDDIGRALRHIDDRAPANRPDPLGSVA